MKLNLSEEHAGYEGAQVDHAQVESVAVNLAGLLDGKLSGQGKNSKIKSRHLQPDAPSRHSNAQYNNGRLIHPIHVDLRTEDLAWQH